MANMVEVAAVLKRWFAAWGCPPEQLKNLRQALKVKFGVDLTAEQHTQAIIDQQFWKTYDTQGERAVQLDESGKEEGAKISNAQFNELIRQYCAAVIKNLKENWEGAYGDLVNSLEEIGILWDVDASTLTFSNPTDMPKLWQDEIKALLADLYKFGRKADFRPAQTVANVNRLYITFSRGIVK